MVRSEDGASDEGPWMDVWMEEELLAEKAREKRVDAVCLAYTIEVGRDEERELELYAGWV